VAILHKSIDLSVARDEAAEAWDRFVESVLVGRRRLACDELVCVGPPPRELVSFEDLGGGRTRLNVTIPVEDGEPVGAPGLMGDKVTRDLVSFAHYAGSDEHNGESAEGHPDGVAASHDARAQRRAPHHGRHDAEPLSRRRSGRA
jgi:hypothetical protein